MGVVIKSFSEIDSAVAMMLDTLQIDAFRRKIAAMENRALYEIPRCSNSCCYPSQVKSLDAKIRRVIVAADGAEPGQAE